MVPSCRELNSDDFPFFRNLSSTSGTRDSFFGSCYKKLSSSSSALIKRNENSRVKSRLECTGDDQEVDARAPD